MMLPNDRESYELSSTELGLLAVVVDTNRRVGCGAWGWSRHLPRGAHVATANYVLSGLWPLKLRAYLLLLAHSL